jgi:hypothetical protein
MFARIKMTVPFDLTKPTIGPILGGESNPFYPLVLFMNDNTPKNQVPDTSGKTLDRYTMDGQNYVYQAEVDQTLFDLSVCGLVAQQGGTVKKYPLYAKIDLDASIPGEGEQPTWGEYLASTPNFKPTEIRTEIGTDHYITTAVFGNGDYMEVGQAIGTFGFDNLVTQPQLMELTANQPAEQPADEPVEGEGGFPAIEDTP